jgi:hypothetical protein
MKRVLVLVLLALTACGQKPGPAGIAGERGADGAPGKDAELPAYTVMSIVDPCEDATGVIDEVLLKLANGQVLVSFSDNSSGKNTRFSLLPPGTYKTTDGSDCVFSLSADGSINY